MWTAKQQTESFLSKFRKVDTLKVLIKLITTFLIHRTEKLANITGRWLIEIAEETTARKHFQQVGDKNE